jgi:hypothetical protein
VRETARHQTSGDAIDDQPAIEVIDGTVVVTEGHRRLFTP